MHSGFWHQIQDKGHPLKNITVRMPGPSSNEFLFRLVKRLDIN